MTTNEDDTAASFTALREADGRTFIIPLIDEEMKVKGVGRINPMREIGEGKHGDEVIIGQKRFTRLNPRLHELRTGMLRRAQIINPKDAGLFLAWMGIGVGDTVFEAGHGSAGLAMQLARILGNSGTLISAENRSEHAEVGAANMKRAKGCFQEFPTWVLLEGSVEDEGLLNDLDLTLDGAELDAAILDLPEPWEAIPGIAERLRQAGRLGCYCPVSSQLEKSWQAAEAAGLEVEWAGEIIERRWTIASKGGVRPGNTPMGHTAFLLIAVKP
jgi:tRNA (adenine57-N1/adenine58-N1)-methyltransferase